MISVRCVFSMFFACGWMALVAWMPQAWAHDGPTEAIEDLTDRIADEGPSAELFARRGDEHRALGHFDLAANDYASALDLDDAWIPALYGLAHVRLECARLTDAERAAERGIRAADHEDAEAPFHALLARIHAKSERNDEALDSWERALASSRPEVDWFLGKAELLWEMDRPAAAEESLRSAMERNPSIVIQRAWLESLIRCGRWQDAQQQIEAGLKNARWKSSWLLLRARLHAAQGKRLESRHDAFAALVEIDLRLRPDSPNPFLAADKARALAMLGRDKEAEEQARVARSLGVPAWKLQGFESAHSSLD